MDRIFLAQPDASTYRSRVLAAAPDTVMSTSDPTVYFGDQPATDLADLTTLRWIQLGSHGYGQLAGLSLHPDAVVTNASGVNDPPIAEWCVMMLFALGRKLPDMLAAQRDHRWDRA